MCLSTPSGVSLYGPIGRNGPVPVDGGAGREASLGELVRASSHTQSLSPILSTHLHA